MPTRIAFAAGRGEDWLSLRVEEDPNDVYDAWNAAGGLPFALTQPNGNKVWVNPTTVAYFDEQPSSSARVVAL